MAQKPFAIALCCLLLLVDRAQGIVGGTQLPGNELGRSVVGILGSPNSFCTATAIARDLLLTAGHCVQPGGDYKVQYKNGIGSKIVSAIVDFARPPQFNLQGMPKTAPTADLALLKLADQLPSNVEVAVLGLDPASIWPGDAFTVIGEGITLSGHHKTGTKRVATLVLAGPYTAFQIRLIDASGMKITTGACAGNSGSPVFQAQTEGTKVIAVVSWAAGPHGTKGCGGATGATLLAPYRQWIEETMKTLGKTPTTNAEPK